MSKKVACPHCQRAIDVNDAFPDQSIYCPMCGKQMMIPPPVAHIVAAPSTVAAQSNSVHYAGFWIRVVANIVDTLVLLIPMIIVDLIIPVVGGLILWIMYKGLFLGNWNGQTIGKKACGIRVVDLTLHPCSMGQAFGRTFAEFLSTIILLIGYLMVAFDGRKQSLHDKMAGTLHVYAT